MRARTRSSRCCFSAASSTWRRLVSSRLPTRRRTWSKSKGFVTKSVAPSPSARRLASGVTSAVRTRIGTRTGPEFSGPRMPRIANPSSCGIVRSSSSRSGLSVRNSSGTCVESLVPVTAAYPQLRSCRVSRRTFAGSSSTTRMRGPSSVGATVTASALTKGLSSVERSRAMREFPARVALLSCASDVCIATLISCSPLIASAPSRAASPRRGPAIHRRSASSRASGRSPAARRVVRPHRDPGPRRT